MRLETSGGASLQLHAVETLATAMAVERLREQIITLLEHGLPVSVTVDDLGSDPDASFVAVCEALASAATSAGVSPALVCIAIDATLLAPQQAWSKRCELLGPGPLYLLVGNRLTPPSINIAARREQDEFWSQCWQLRHCRHVRIALAPVVSSPCPLLPPENASGILLPSGLQSPPGTAWIQMQLDLTRYADENGEIDECALHDCLRLCIETGESMHDEMDWLTAAMRHDAWLNRRLAISISGIGDLAKLRGLDPRCFATQKDLGSVLQDVRDVVNERSRQLARKTQPAPSLNMVGVYRDADWQARWQNALQLSAMRHRNLLAMSPWAVFPSDVAADSRYADLLPLLQYADACSFPQPPCLRAWNINEFKHFHHRLSAVLEKKDARQLIAEQV
jgi:hypothetical protein